MNAQTPKLLPKPISYDELYPGRFIKAADLRGKRTTLTIVDVIMEELQDEKGVKQKGSLKFKGTEKQLALNRTNGECIKGMFGHLLADWLGKRVTIEPVPYDGSLKLDITHMIRLYGSPDIPKDIQVTVRLPRRRPFMMTMHKVPLGGRQAMPSENASAEAPPASEEKPTPRYDQQTAMQMLREAGDVAGIEKVWAEIRIAFDKGVPIEVESLYTLLKEGMQ